MPNAEMTTDTGCAASSEEDLLKREAQYCSWGDTVHYAEKPKLFERCEGCYLFDRQGTPYLDLQMWYSAVNLGYANERVNRALKQQIDKLPQLACQYLHREKIELAEEIAKSVEKSFGVKGRVHFNVGGAQAVEDALKLVRKNTGRQHMLAFEGGYHGRTLGASAITSSYRYREAFGEFADRAVFLPFPYPFRSGFPNDDKACEDHYIRYLEKMFEHEYTGAWNPKTGRSEFGAFFVEAVQGTGGYIVPPRGYFKRLEKICREHGILIVDDEIQMGFYRTGKMWALENFEVQPDIIVFGKALTNGMNPLSGIWAREELISPDRFGPGSTHSTFSSNSLGTTTGLEVMRIYKETDYAAMIEEKGAYLLRILAALQTKHPEVGDVGRLGFALRMEMCEADGFTPSRRLADRMFQCGLDGHLDARGRQMGLILDIGGYYKNVVTLAPSFTMTKEELDLAGELLDQVLQKAKSN